MKKILIIIMFFISMPVFAKSDLNNMLVNKIKELSTKIKNNKQNEIADELMVKFTTEIYGIDDEKRWPYIYDLSKLSEMDFVFYQLYFILEHIEFDDNNELIRKCYALSNAKYDYLRVELKTRGFETFCINDVSFQNNFIIIEYIPGMLLDPGVSKPNVARRYFYIKYKPIDNSFRLDKFIW